jgi:hypothetical protein
VLVGLLERFPGYTLSSLLDEGTDLLRMTRLVDYARGVTASHG